MQAYSVHAWVTLCAQTHLASSPDYIDTLISLIQLNLAKIRVCAHNHIVCMHASLCDWVTLYTHTWPACSPDSKDTLISLI